MTAGFLAGTSLPMAAESQASDAVLMVRPAAFGFNPETAATNVFAAAVANECALAAAAEFDRAAERLAGAGVEVVVLQDSPEPAKPDAAFPNNWVSFHGDGRVVLYPMAVPSRRNERRADALLDLLATRGFKVSELVDLSGQEECGQVLEGTGSLVLDRPRQRAYAALGPRTDRNALAEFERRLGYSTFAFDAADRYGRPIYHTNVMMSLGTRFAMLCTEAVAEDQRKRLVDDIEATGRTIIAADYWQLRGFACNLLELRSSSGDPLIALSASARASLRRDQIATLERLGGELVDAAIPTIEAVGGGSLRCMLADVHLPRVSPAI
ncbi:MAG: arginine deiminase-related protein [Pseudomonadota bacterium]|nr:arginine deiminase-related protein [Pseudomonadota bacterium]